VPDPVAGPFRGRGQRGPKPLLGDEPRDRIYEAALRCFDRAGISRSSMDAVAREAGVSRPTVYYYFSSKDDLVAEVVTRQAANMLRDTKRKLAGLDGIGRLVEAVYLGVRASVANQYVRLLIGGDTAGLTGRLMNSEQLRGLERDFWTPLLEDALGTGVLRQDRDVDDVIRLIVFIQFSLVTHHSAFELSDRQIRDWLIAYLGPALAHHAES
jgi:AcrR family transcriptional regulator